MARALWLTALLFLAGCHTPSSEPNTPPGDDISSGNGPPERVFGTVAYYDEPVKITVPESAVAGKPFAVTVTTYGNGCIEKGETDVRTEPLRAEIRPYDYNVTPGRECPEILRTFEHEATLSFARAGEAEIVFYGQAVSTDGVSNTRIVETLEILPVP